MTFSGGPGLLSGTVSAVSHTELTWNCPGHWGLWSWVSFVCREAHALLPGYCAFKPTAWKCCLAVTCPWNSGPIFRGPGVGLEERTLCLYSRGCLLRAIKPKPLKKKYFLLWLNILTGLYNSLPFIPDLSILGEENPGGPESTWELNLELMDFRRIPMRQDTNLLVLP